MLELINLRSVCLLLGPYRNLTTLTAATVFLHPNCQVLNHAGAHILGDSAIDFLRDHSPDVFRAFLVRAVSLSEDGQRGNRGGSIVHSHAFDDVHAMKTLCRDMIGVVRIKPEIHSFVWKESNQVSNYIRRHGINLDQLFLSNGLIRFLMPVRNPIDCAFSCLTTGHYKHLVPDGDSLTPTVYEVLSAILAEHHWFQSLKKRHPDRFFSFFEYEMNRKTLLDIGRFLELASIEQWADHAAKVFVSKRTYEKPEGMIQYYCKQVESVFSDDPALAEKFLRFVRDSQAMGRHESADA